MTHSDASLSFIGEMGIEFVLVARGSGVRSTLGVTTTTTPEDALCLTAETILEILGAAGKTVPGWTSLPTLADLKNARAHTRSGCVTPVEILRAMHEAFEEVRELHPSLLRWASKRNVQHLEKMLRQARDCVQRAYELQSTSGGKMECFEQIVRTSELLVQHVKEVGTTVNHENNLAQKGGASLVITPLKKCYQSIFREAPSGGWKNNTDGGTRVNHADSAFIRFATKFCAEANYPLRPETLQDALYRKG